MCERIGFHLHFPHLSKNSIYEYMDRIIHLLKTDRNRERLCNRRQSDCILPRINLLIRTAVDFNILDHAVFGISKTKYKGLG